MLSTIQFGAAGTVISTAAFGPEVSVPFFVGSLAGAFYLYLLGKKTDSIGSGDLSILYCIRQALILVNQFSRLVNRYRIIIFNLGHGMPWDFQGATLLATPRKPDWSLCKIKIQLLNVHVAVGIDLHKCLFHTNVNQTNK